VQELLVRGEGGVARFRRKLCRAVASKYSMIAIDSTMITSPSWMAGMKPAGLTARNSGSFSTPASKSTGRRR
jgi:hypothetical protein